MRPGNEVDVFAYKCAFCWDTGWENVTVHDMDGNAYHAPRPCREGCPMSEEVD